MKVGGIAVHLVGLETPVPDTVICRIKGERKALFAQPDAFQGDFEFLGPFVDQLLQMMAVLFQFLHHAFHFSDVFLHRNVVSDRYAW